MESYRREYQYLLLNLDILLRVLDILDTLDKSSRVGTDLSDVTTSIGFAGSLF